MLGSRLHSHVYPVFLRSLTANDGRLVKAGAQGLGNLALDPTLGTVETV